MPENPPLGRLVAFGLATFHALFFILILLFFLYSLGGLGDLLEGLNTLAGYVIFAALWTTTWWTTRQALRNYFKRRNQGGEENWIETMLRGEFEVSQVFVNGVIWGGLNGFLFLIALAVILLVYVFVLSIAALLAGSANPGASLTLILFVLIGSPVGAFVGGLVGLILALVDGAVLGLVRRLFKE
jgi:hypothetical protein